VVYREDADRERMFEKPELVFKDGELVVRDGRIFKVVRGGTHAVKPEFDIGIEKKIKPYFERFHSVRMNNFKISDDELCACGGGSKLIPHACRKRG
jgi:formylmethanofuran dehydrogenase subunit A